jgi:hypothetical protein
VGTGCAGLVCPETVAPGPAITTMGTTSGGILMFGEGADSWGSFTYAIAGPTPPTATLTADGDGIQIVGGSLGRDDYEGVGLYYNNTTCLNGAAYNGLKFDFAGTVGACQLRVGVTFSGDVPPSDDVLRGACVGTGSTCYGPVANVTAAAMAATPSAPTIEVPFASMSGGAPIATVDPTKIVSVQWQFVYATATDGAACSTNFTVENVSFY